MNDKVKEQILSIRATGKTNMFDITAVQRLSFEMGYKELIDFIETNQKTYAHFILTGDSDEPEIASD